MEYKFTRRKSFPLFPAIIYSVYESFNQQETPLEDQLEEEIRRLTIELNNSGTYDDAKRITSGVLAHQNLYTWFANNNQEAATQLFLQSSSLYEPFRLSGFSSPIPDVWKKIKSMGWNLLSSGQAKEQFSSGYIQIANSIENLLFMPEIVSVFINNNQDKCSSTNIQPVCEEYTLIQTQADLIKGVLAIQGALMGELPNHPDDLTYNQLTSSNQSLTTLRLFQQIAREMAVVWLSDVESNLSGQTFEEIKISLANAEVFIPLTLNNGQFAA